MFACLGRVYIYMCVDMCIFTCVGMYTCVDMYLWMAKCSYAWMCMQFVYVTHMNNIMSVDAHVYVHVRDSWIDVCNYAHTLKCLECM